MEERNRLYTVAKMIFTQLADKTPCSEARKLIEKIPPAFKIDDERTEITKDFPIDGPFQTALKYLEEHYKRCEDCKAFSFLNDLRDNRVRT